MGLNDGAQLALSCFLHSGMQVHGTMLLRFKVCLPRAVKPIIETCPQSWAEVGLLGHSRPRQADKQS